jgi:hypothetical protein
MQTLSLNDFITSRPAGSLPALHNFMTLLPKLPALGKNGPWLVGGTVRRLVAGENMETDIDIMFKNQQQFDDYVGAMYERGAEVIEENDRQITFNYEGWKVQPIRAVFSNTLIQTLNKFDFTICQFGFDGTNLVWGDESMQHLEAGQLVFINTTDYVSSLRRAFKYAKQGFFMEQNSISRFFKKAIENSLKVETDLRKWETEVKASGRFWSSDTYP